MILQLNSEDKYSHLVPILQGIAHELRNPIQGLMATAAVLKLRLEGNGGAGPFLEMMLRDTARIDDVINQLLQLIQPVQVSDSTYDVTKLLEDSIRIMSERRDVSIRFQADQVPLIRMDIHMLGLAFREILTNAVESGKADVAIDVILTTEDSFVAVEIRDNGEGIAKNLLPRVFDPFVSTRPRKTGIGLCIVDRVVGLHNGAVTIQSTQGMGTEVKVKLPF